MHDTLIVQFLQAFGYLLQEATNELLTNRFLLPLCYDIVSQTGAQILANEVNFPILFEVIDQFRAELALFHGLEHSELLEKIRLFRRAVVVSVGRRNEFHLQIFTRESVPHQPSLIKVVIWQLADQLVLVYPLSELLGGKQAFDALKEQRVAQKEEVAVACLRGKFAGEEAPRATNNFSIGRIYRGHVHIA